MLNNSSYEPHGTYVSGFTFLLNQEGPKKPQSIFHFRHGGGTHFLVLAQTLIYIFIIYLSINYASMQFFGLVTKPHKSFGPWNAVPVFQRFLIAWFSVCMVVAVYSIQCVHNTLFFPLKIFFFFNVAITHINRPSWLACLRPFVFQKNLLGYPLSFSSSNSIFF